MSCTKSKGQNVIFTKILAWQQIMATKAQMCVSHIWEMFDLTCILNKACPLPKGPWGFRLCSHPAQYHGAAFHPLNKFAPNSKFWRNVFSPSFTCRMSHRGAWRRGGRSWLGRRKTTPSGCIHGLIKSNAWCKRKSIQAELLTNWTCDLDPPCHKTSWRVSRSRILSCALANLQVVLPAAWPKSDSNSHFWGHYWQKEN